MKSVILASSLLLLVCYTQANVVLEPRKAAGTLEIDEGSTDEWVRLFYDNCGRTWKDEDKGMGTYVGSETVKRCIGDRDGCIEKRNCFFAVAITESAAYQKKYESTTEGETKTTVFENWERLTNNVQITLLDACHLDPLPAGLSGNATVDKFVGVAFGIFDTTNKLACNFTNPNPSNTEVFQNWFKIENIRAYFAISDFSRCNIQPTIPVHPYQAVFEAIEDNIKQEDPIKNTMELDSVYWNDMCTAIKDTVGDQSFDGSTSEEIYMKHLLIHHYGTPGYTNPDNFGYMNTNDKRDVARILPLQADRKIDEGNEQSGSLGIHAVSALVFIVPLVKYLF